MANVLNLDSLHYTYTTTKAEIEYLVWWDETKRSTVFEKPTQIGQKVHKTWSLLTGASQFECHHEFYIYHHHNDMIYIDFL